MYPPSPTSSQEEDGFKDGNIGNIGNTAQPVWRRMVNMVAVPWKDGFRPSLHRRVYLLLAVIMLIILSVVLGVFVSKAHSSTSNIDVDLGYATYRGVNSSDTGISQWLGMRYAAPPLGNLRFRAAQDPPNTSGVQLANIVSTEDFL